MSDLIYNGNDANAEDYQQILACTDSDIIQESIRGMNCAEKEIGAI